MGLAPGTRIGAYEIVSMLGAGGMGEVYKARDTQLKRDVAIKVLPETFATDPERLARFQREAEVLASLNHPHIAHIHGLEQAGRVRALVMEFIDGEDLAQKIARGPIAFDEALPIARQIAEALDAAHGQGIIHRDLKPANIKVRADGTVKVLDFGLAKAMEPAVESASQSPTITTPAMTQAGVILGTAAYMSPEQAKGKPADKRSDVWAFGCVLYEMLAGTRAFRGEDVSDTLASVLRGEPEWAALPPTVSPAIVALIRGCLTKDPRQRIGDISTARFIFDHGTEVAISVPGHSLSTLRRSAPILIASAAAVVIAAYLTWMLKPVPAPLLPLARFPITLPTTDRFTSFGRHLVALSSDGSRLVYVANDRLYMRAMDQLEPAPIRGTEGLSLAAPRSPFFSPDGKWIGFWQDGQLKKVPTTGGAPVPLCGAITPFGASWTTDNTILFGQGEDGIWRVSGDGGTAENVIKVEKGEIAHGPQLLPGGRAVLFTLARDGRDWDAAQIVIQSLDTRIRRHLSVEGAVQNRTPVLLIFSLALPSVEAKGRWRERGRIGRRALV
jgi:eukaryotic-like serine/threonine-protein kinase